MKPTKIRKEPVRPPEVKKTPAEPPGKKTESPKK
jgi:hypothetical protein